MPSESTDYNPYNYICNLTKILISLNYIVTGIFSGGGIIWGEKYFYILGRGTVILRGRVLFNFEN